MISRMGQLTLNVIMALQRSRMQPKLADFRHEAQKIRCRNRSIVSDNTSLCGNIIQLRTLASPRHEAQKIRL